MLITLHKYLIELARLTQIFDNGKEAHDCALFDFRVVEIGDGNEKDWGARGRPCGAPEI